MLSKVVEKMETTTTAVTAVTAAASSTNTATITFAGAKLLSVVTGGMGFAAIIVMVMTNPTSRKELACALISTMISSFAGGSSIIQYYHLQSLVFDTFGLMTILGIFFVSGLPAWGLVRAVFVYIEKNKAKGIDEIIRDAKDLKP